MQIRIQGLVAFLNRVRGQLQSGIPEKEVEPLKNEIRTVIQQVEDICRQYNSTPGALPGPSRNAYQFLKNLDLQNLPLRTADKPVKTNQPVKIKNIVAIGDYLSQHFWRDATKILASERLLRDCLEKLQHHCEHIEQICQRQSGTPSNLPKPSQQVYCWLKFLSNPNNLTAHLKALDLTRQLLQKIPEAKNHPPLEIHLVNMQAIYRYRGYHNCIVLKCSEGFIYATDDVWQEVLNAVFRKKAKRSPTLDAYTHSEAFTGVIFEMESTINPPENITKGHVHDLDASFQRVNQQYFQGKIERPRIHWNRLLTSGKMGHYQTVSDTVMISISLDQPGVPEYVVDYVMYHELLHKKHGSKIINGRRYAHTPTFRQDEQQFKQYESAKNFLDKLALKQRGINLPEPVTFLRKLFSNAKEASHSLQKNRHKQKSKKRKKKKRR